MPLSGFRFAAASLGLSAEGLLRIVFVAVVRRVGEKGLSHEFLWISVQFCLFLLLLEFL